ncbi:AGAP002966-PA-like protein [Anopheles sinensis]|uniref:non-specific serine/threonine protein kinase n=1 Tax=Anopheles sinensis TaxID=74873 RepID=A0A084VZA9_ANOSI|nr:AGAP002966-PA-like protein [Anopheles sinensis]
MAPPNGEPATVGLAAQTNSAISVTKFANFEYIHQLPRMETKRLAALLEIENKWYDLGVKHMGYARADLENLYECMEVIKQYVHPRYHGWIKQPKLGAAMGTFSGTDPYNNPIAGRRPNEPSPLLQPTKGPTNCNEPANGSNSKENSPFANEMADLSGMIPKINYEDLTAATDNWSERNILGKGGFGTVYRGVFKHTYMAIKKIDYKKMKTRDGDHVQLQQSINELRFLNACRHDNIVPLFGYSIGNEPCLVYQYMPGGSLDKSLFARRPASPLTWKERMNIARGTAKGLQYLHTFGEKPFIHGDIKPGNILLNEFKQPRIGDFGLTRLGARQDKSMVVSRVYGTRPYIPREFYDRKELSTKVDTYSFGVVLYEIGTGLRAYDERRTDKHLKDYIARAVHANVHVSELMDKSLPDTDADGLRFCYNMLMAGHLCTADDPKQRPDMVAVMWHLDKA